MEQRFDTPSAITLDVRIPAGSVAVDALDAAETEVRVEPLNGPARDAMDRLVVALEGHTLRIESPQGRFSFGRSPEFAVAVRCPTGSSVRLRTAAADLLGRGRLGGVEVKSASADVTVEELEGDLRSESASGDVRAETVAGLVEVRTASGDLDLRHAHGPVNARSVSGDVRVGASDATLEVQTVSGDLRAERVAGGPVTVNAVSGDVELAIAPGAAVFLDLTSLSGDMRSSLEPGDGPAEGEQLLEIRGKTVSGDVRIRRASA
ncbi:MAG TPA: DUF4097 family beta strand repeat-containing protein [Gaiellaceae bacterium]|nr:DUF4097 family beta strand repeat-containing protein [Gaiellaceae bacterium]